MIFWKANLSLIFLITTPLIALVIYFVMSKSLPLYKIIQSKLDNISLITRENLEGSRVIKAFSKEEAIEKAVAATEMIMGQSVAAAMNAFN